MSNYNIINNSLEEIHKHLAQYDAEVKLTKYDNTYIIKFNPKTKAYDPAVNMLRGLIFNKQSNTIYSLGFPVPIEFKDQSKEEQDNIINKINLHKYQVYEAMDGTLIRLWYNNALNKWITSTNNVEDAYDSIWVNNTSFGTLFEQSTNIMTQQLNKDYVYIFTLCHPRNIIVVNYETPKIYHITTYDRTTLKEVKCDCGIMFPKIFDITVGDVLAKVQNSIETPVMSAGYIIAFKDKDEIVRRYRFENVNYTRGRILRGNSNNNDLIILKHLMSNNPNDIKEFLIYYPIFKGPHSRITYKLDKLCLDLYQEYVDKYIKHKQPDNTPLHHRYIIHNIHTHVYMRKLRPYFKYMTLEDIKTFIYSQDPEEIIQLM